MKVFKFGGASVKDADAVRNVALILKNYQHDDLVIIVSAMGKTTNALEKVLSDWFSQDEMKQQHLEEIFEYHLNIMHELFHDGQHPVFFKSGLLFGELEGHLSSSATLGYDYQYDQVVSFGELLSTLIVSEFLAAEGFNCRLLDARELIRTDDTWREGKVDWEITSQLIKNQLQKTSEKDTQPPLMSVTQGFIGATEQGHTTTLGREGSDYTAAIFSYVLNASEMTVWKDVPGILNADPKYFDDTVLIKDISYREAIELTYYGASVIHPKTIKPLQNKNIPLFIKSFIDSTKTGTVIQQGTINDHLIPSFIFKVNQVLISISPRDFSFIDEQNLSDILAIFASRNIHIHLMQNSALSFSVCVDYNERRLNELFQLLEKDFRVLFNTGLELITIRHYDQATIDRVMADGKEILLEMRSRITAQFVVKPIL
ncbi:MAG: aspartate kinase [Bacteroidales bacterium]|nr:aspartate kinase [Bacteroidales bacterium]